MTIEAVTYVLFLPVRRRVLEPDELFVTPGTLNNLPTLDCHQVIGPDMIFVTQGIDPKLYERRAGYKLSEKLRQRYKTEARSLVRSEINAAGIRFGNLFFHEELRWKPS